jgi:hypothetical protein
MKKLPRRYFMKKQYQLENFLTLVFGIWVMFSPFIGGRISNYPGANVYIWNFIFVGLTVIIMSVFALRDMVNWAERLCLYSGIWLMLSPLFLIFYNLSNFYFWNAVISGGLIAFTSGLALPKIEKIHYHKHKVKPGWETHFLTPHRAIHRKKLSK